jgi:hypothetical protein
MLSTGLPTIDAQDDFRRARRSGRLARLLGAGSPRSLCARAMLPAGRARLEVVPLTAIVGTIEPGSGFDARVRPTTTLVRSRWERVALAHRTGKALPPVSLVRRPEGHYVVDGRHRISVARALKLDDIEAWVRA